MGDAMARSESMNFLLIFSKKFPQKNLKNNFFCFCFFWIGLDWIGWESVMDAADEFMKNSSSSYVPACNVVIEWSDQLEIRS